MAKDTLPTYNLVGGRLCLDFCNTTSNRRRAPVETRAHVLRPDRLELAGGGPEP